MGARYYVCPRCGSLDVEPDRLTPLGQRFVCRDCGYQGAFVIEAENPEEAARISRELQADRKREEEDGPPEEQDAPAG